MSAMLFPTEDKAPEHGIYPLTITTDRYQGAYSGGIFIAWPLKAYEVPYEIYLDDITCLEFWSNNPIICGKGKTVNEAVADLYAKLKEAQRND